MAKVKIAAAITEYLEELTHVRRLAVATLKAYRRDLQQWLEAMLDLKCEQLEELSEQQLRHYFMSLSQQGLSAKSLARIRSCLSGFYRFVMREGLAEVSANPLEMIGSPKVGRKLPNVLDADMVTRLLDIPLKNQLDLRDKAILELFYSSGLRLSELSELRWTMIDLGQGMLRVLGKGGKERVVPVGGKAVAALQQWLPDSSNMNRQVEDWVFISNRGSRLKPRSIQARVKLHAQRQGLWSRVYPHLLRHSFASHLLESSGDLRGVQEMLGHANLATTQIYTHLNFQHLAAVYDQSHPRAKKRRSPKK